MDIKFLNKKIPFKIVIIVLLIIIGGIGAIFYWQKTHIPSDISPEAAKVKCLEDVSKINDQELINEIKLLKYPDEIIPSLGEARINYATKQMIRYLICRVDDSRNEEDYNSVKSFIKELNIQEENKQNSLVRLDEVYSQESNFLRAINVFTTQLALGDLDKICPSELPSICHECYQNDDSNKARILQFMDCHGKIYCDYICEIIQKCFNDKNYFEEFFLKLQYNEPQCTEPETYKPKKLSYKIENIGPWRIALAYRIGGREVAYKICDIFEDEMNDKCIDHVNGILHKILDDDKCDKKTIAEIICY